MGSGMTSPMMEMLSKYTSASEPVIAAVATDISKEIPSLTSGPRAKVLLYVFQTDGSGFKVVILNRSDWLTGPLVVSENKPKLMTAPGPSVPL